MNNHKPPIIGLYILYTLILIAAVIFFTSRRFLSVQVTVPTTEEASGTTAVVSPAGEEVSGTMAVVSPAGEEVSNITEASSMDSSASAETVSAPAADSNDAKTTPAAGEWIVPLPENPLPPVPFVSKCRINLHIRQQPSLSAKIIGRIPTRASGIIIELVDDQWAKIIYQDITGYSAYRYLDFDPAFGTAVSVQEEVPETTASLESEPVPEEASAATDEETVTQVSEQAVIVIRSSCYIRSSAGDKNKRNIIMTAQSNDTFPHMAAYDQPSWYAIAVEGQSLAYVSTKYAAAQTTPAD